MSTQNLPDLFLPLVDPAVEALHQATALYTQQTVVDEVLDMAGWGPDAGRLLDPGAGDGVFLERALARIPLIRNDPSALAARVQGWEIHPVAALEARERIWQHLQQRGWNTRASQEAAHRIIIEADFLHPGPIREHFDIIAGNPPFLRFANLPEPFKTLYRETIPDYARADILHAFLDRSLRVLTPGGVIACVTADRWLFNRNAARLRQKIGEHLGLLQCRRLDVSTSFYRPKVRRAGTPPRIHPVVVLLSPQARNNHPIGTAPLYPNGPNHLPDGMIRLGEVARTRLAPWLGAHGIFTLDRSDAEALGIPPEHRAPCVDTDDVEGNTFSTPRRVALRTSRKNPPHPTVLEHLKKTVGRLPASARRSPFWIPPEGWGNLPLPHEAILIPRIARGLRLLRLPANVLPINHNLTVVSLGPDPDILLQALQNPDTEAWLQRCAPRLEGGYLSITTELLRQLPIQLPEPGTTEEPRSPLFPTP